MGKKILSSRIAEGEPLQQLLEEMLLAVWDVIEFDDDREPPETLEGTVRELDLALTGLIIKVMDLSEANYALQTDLLAHTVSNAALTADLIKATKMIVGLTGPAMDDSSLSGGLRALTNVGNASFRFDGIANDVAITFKNEEALKEGLRAAIENYNSDLANKILHS
jgi:hypothetical protein